MQQPTDDFTKSATYQDELRRMSERRKALDLPATTRPWGLALSGGGIRSATFALGVIQSLAKQRGAKENSPPLLARFDYLSTVSGGGYIGSFLGALFRPASARGAEAQLDSQQSGSEQAQQEAKQLCDTAYQCLASDPPGRMTRELGADTPDLPLRWLRENGRYMAPSGVGDLFYAASLQIRNWFAVQYVIGISLLVLSLLALGFRALSQTVFDADDLWGLIWQTEALLQPSQAGELWWSPWFWAMLLLLGVVACPIGIAYWFTYRRNPHEALWLRVVKNPVAAALLLIASGSSLTHFAVHAPINPAIGVASAWLTAVLVFSLIAFLCSRQLSNTSIALQRTMLTQWLTTAFRFTAYTLLLGVVETLGQSLYLLLIEQIEKVKTSPAPTLSALFAALAALLPLIKKLAQIATNKQSTDKKSTLSFGVLIAPLSVMLIFSIAIAWYLLAITLFFGGENPLTHVNADLSTAHPIAAHPIIAHPLASSEGLHYLLAVLVTALIALAGAGYFVGFLNLSSLATLYSARLTRAYLGASNKARFATRHSNLSVAAPHAHDDFKPQLYYNSLHYGPLHLINITINSTTGGDDNLTQMDRKGLPLTITPAGLSANGSEARPFTTPQQAVATGGVLQDVLPNATGEHLTLGQWIGISGAAFAPGLGRGTSRSMATLCALANVRLGYWWNSGKERSDVGSKLNAFICNQRYLFREMMGRFYGTDRHFWYLSDGGHFENTAVYELLRRRCEVVVVCDDGADGDYQFEDLANLMRLARIDFGADFTLLEPTAAYSDFMAAGLPLSNKSDCFAASPTQLNKTLEGTQCALAYRISYRDFDEATLLLVIKPRLTEDAPLDLLQYRATHDTFPQESTLDQFFDEAQWESYRKLGALSGDRVFGA
jgi:hypothetical protein